MADEKCPECGGFRGLPRILHDDPENPKECNNEFHRTAELPEVIPFPIQDVAQGVNVVAKEETNMPGSAKFVPNPICPYCGADPCNLKARTLKMGPFELLLVRCANDECRKTISVFPVAFEGPETVGSPGRFVS